MLVRLPLVRVFRTSSSNKDHLDHILVRAESESGGFVGWGECASPADPYYCADTTETCWHILRDFLVPSVLGKEWLTIEDLIALFGPSKGHGLARPGVEESCWDMLAKRLGTTLHG